jgi:hypothetical protein
VNENVFPIHPYSDGTSGWSGSQTSKESAKRRETKQQATHDWVLKSGFHGITDAEIDSFTGWGHGTISACLTNLHDAGLITYLDEVRGGQSVYVALEFLGDRKPGKRKRRRSYVSGVEDEQRRILYLLLDCESETITPTEAIKAIRSGSW